jgi:hypothetical protein
MQGHHAGDTAPDYFRVNRTLNEPFGPGESTSTRTAPSSQDSPTVDEDAGAAQIGVLAGEAANGAAVVRGWRGPPKRALEIEGR